MYFIPTALLIKQFGGEAFWAGQAAGADTYASLTWAAFGRNLLPVTIGNILGGVVLVGIVYWFIYLRPGREA